MLASVSEIEEYPAHSTTTMDPDADVFLDISVLFLLLLALLMCIAASVDHISSARNGESILFGPKKAGRHRRRAKQHRRTVATVPLLRMLFALGLIITLHLADDAAGAEPRPTSVDEHGTGKVGVEKEHGGTSSKLLSRVGQLIQSPWLVSQQPKTSESAVASDLFDDEVGNSEAEAEAFGGGGGVSCLLLLYDCQGLY